jgi:hypothetical protein
MSCGVICFRLYIDSGSGADGAPLVLDYRTYVTLRTAVELYSSSCAVKRAARRQRILSGLCLSKLMSSLTYAACCHSSQPVCCLSQ